MIYHILNIDYLNFLYLRVNLVINSCMCITLKTSDTHSPKLQCIITDLLNNSMFHPISAKNNSLLMLYTTFLNAILHVAHLTYSHEHSKQWLHCTLQGRQKGLKGG